MSENINETVDELAQDVAAEVEEESLDLTATLTADLQRLQAEYSNYRKRVERDRAVASEIAIAAVLSELLATLDDIDRAAEHGRADVHTRVAEARRVGGDGDGARVRVRDRFDRHGARGRRGDVYGRASRETDRFRLALRTRDDGKGQIDHPGFLRQCPAAIVLEWVLDRRKTRA